MTKSVGMRWPVGENDDFVTDLGVVEIGCPRPDRGEVGPLCLALREWVEDIRGYGATLMPDHRRRTRISVTEQDGRIFMHADYPWDNNPTRWTWEMFDAHWAPDSPHCDDRPMMDRKVAGLMRSFKKRSTRVLESIVATLILTLIPALIAAAVLEGWNGFWLTMAAWLAATALAAVALARTLDLTQ